MAPSKLPTTKRLARRRAYRRAEYAADPIRFRWKSLKHRHGITLAEYQKMFAAQNGLCAICQRQNLKSDGTAKWLVVDHDHVTDVVRGLLCDPCNRGIGFLRDDVENLERAVEYLRRSRGNVVALLRKEN